MQSIAINECPPLAEPTAKIAELSFLERYPELAFYLQKDPALGRKMEAHYRRVEQFCRYHLAPHVLDIDLKLRDDPHYVPHELLKKACDYRLFSMMFPASVGGAGEHVISAFMTYEMIASHCVGVANLLGVSGLALACVLASFDPRAISKVARLIVDNEKKGIPTFLSTCVTEPGAGSDAEDADEFTHAQLRTTAKRVPGGYRLNGNKVFISNGALAALHVVVAYDADGAHRPEDLLLFLVARGSEGLSVPRNEKKMGQKVCPASEVVFEDVFVPDEMVCRTGDKGSYFAYTGIANVLGLTRAGVGAFATGVTENAYRTALQFVRSNDFLGQPMEQQQWVRIELANLARRAQVARATYVSALLAVCAKGLANPITRVPDWGVANWALTQPGIANVRDSLLDSSIAEKLFKRIAATQTTSERDTVTAYGDVAKVSCSELAMENCQRAISLMGKGGFRHENGAEKLLRDVKLLQIYEGTNQVNMLDFVKRRLPRQFSNADTLV
ncbi:Acyl-CoA dehydrogenase [gamma proteobacterium HdN1]|nr:Acyl-CoA dehydrogenase [gamma proteobacterium HdN1]